MSIWRRIVISPLTLLLSASTSHLPIFGLSILCAVMCLINPSPSLADPDTALLGKRGFKMKFPSEANVLDEHNTEPLQHVFIVDSNLLEVLRQFADHNHLALNADKSIKGRVLARRYSLDKELFMKQIGQDFEVSLFEHNRTLFVAKKSDSSTRILNLGRLAARDVMKYLIDSQVVFPQFPLRIADSKRAIYVSGPTVYISLIKTLIDEYYDVVNPSNLTVTSYGQKRSVDLSTPDKEKKGLFK